LFDGLFNLYGRLLMKKATLFALSVSLMGTTGLALAQDAAPATSAPSTASAPAGPGAKMGEHPRIREVHQRLMRQRVRIAAAVKAGKMTQDEAKPLMDKVKAIREEMRSDIKSNGKTELTDEQFSQLNQELNANSDAIKDDQGGAGSGSAPSTGTASGAPATSTGAPATNP
jgi:small-conductance mechanosensitive channel